MRLIKRYKNRRLYDTETKQMVTMEELSQMVKEGVEFEVVDNVTKKDITGEVLTTILKSEVKSWNDLKASGNLFKELIRKKGEGAATVIKKTALASIGAASLDKKRAEEIIDELIKKGEVASTKRGEDLKKLIGKADEQSQKILEQSKKLMGKIEDQVKGTIEKYRKEQREEMEDIRNRINTMEETLKRIEEKL